MAGEMITHVNKQLEVEKSKESLHILRLPNDLITYGILTRVPAESLIRFRCVCKHWSNLIFDPLFADSHSRHSRQRYNNNLPSGGFICTNRSGQFHRLFYHGFSAKMTKVNPQDDGLGDEIRTLYSLNGLLLLTSKHLETRCRNFQVYNPITGRSKTLPLLNQLPGNTIFGLAYDRTIAKYKVVCCGYCHAREEYFCKIVTVGVERDSWRDVVVPKPHRIRQYQPVYAKGSLHWMIAGNTKVWNLDWTYVIEPESEEKILSMDVVREIFYTIEHPKQSSNSGVHSLLEMRGLLCFVDHVSNTRLKLWVLKEDLENKKHEWMEECDCDFTEYMTTYKLRCFEGFLVNTYPFAILTNPKYKMIFMCFNKSSKETTKTFFSYDIELSRYDDKVITFLLQDGYFHSSSPFELARFSPHWHVNSLTCF